MPVNPLPEIVETKETLDGGRTQFRCRLLEEAPGRVVVLFVSSAVYQVGTLTLPAGTVTFGHFWADRPYNAYHWMSPGGSTLAYYFNIADRTRLSDSAITFRDLAVDVLVRGGAPEVLDEHELPADIDPQLRSHIAAATAEVVAAAPALGAELEAAADRLWPTAFGRPR